MSLLKKLQRTDRGEVLILALLMLALGSIMTASLVRYMGTGLKAVRTNHNKTDMIYAADAGIQYATWKITSGSVPQNVDFSLTYPAITVNSKSVVVRIDYFWLLTGIVDAQFGPHNMWLDVQTSGNPQPTGIYEINLVYSLESGNPGNKKIDQMGVWLPVGYQYVPGSSSDPEFPDNIDTSEPSVTPIHGGTSIKWTNVNYSFKNGGEVARQRFRFTPIGRIPKGDIAWVSSLSNDIGLSWDQMIWTYKITSSATNESSADKHTTIVAEVTSDTGATSGLGILTYAIDPPGS